MSDNNDHSSTEKEKTTTKTDAASTEQIPPEVFDSSTYDSMTDLKTSATMNKSEVNKVLSDIENKEPIESETVHIESTTNANTSPTTTTAVTPTMEGHASALKKSKETQNKPTSRQLDKQTTQINKKITQILQPLQKHIKSVDKQSELIRQIQSQLKQLQRQVSQMQKAVGMGKGKKKDSK
jgi:DNA anti-recombination protein RmuC